MKLECLDEHTITYQERQWKFEETSIYGDIYEVADELGKELLATGKFASVEEVAEGQHLVTVSLAPEVAPAAPPPARRRRASDPEPSEPSEPEPGPEE